MSDISSPAPAGQPQEHFVRLRDGVRLATDVYLPEGFESGPTVLVRTPYDKRSRYTFLPQCAPYFNERGYAFVVQDVRGKYRSEGVTLQAVHEVADGHDTLDWIVGQGWSDGVVGMFGDSYYAYTQWAALASGHRALRALSSRMTSLAPPTARPVGVTTPGTGPGVTPSRPGFSRPPSLDWAKYLGFYWLDQDEYEPQLDWSLRPPIRVFNDAFEQIGRRSPTFDAAIPHHIPQKVFVTGHPYDGPSVPVLHTLGWFDPIAKGGIGMYLELAKRPAWAPLQYLVAEAVDHENYHVSDTPYAEDSDHDVNDAALARMLPRYLGPSLDFFDVYLRGVKDPASLPRVSWDLAHAGRQQAAQWPLPDVREQILYLNDFAAAAGAPPGGRLTTIPPADAESVQWTHDPDNPVRQEGEFLSLIRDYPDESHLGGRKDVVVFTSDAVGDAPVDLAGPVRVEVVVESDAPSTDLFVSLFDVYPNGEAHRMLSEQVTVDEMQPGGVLCELDLGHTGYRLRPGHALRLHFRSSDAPDYLPHPGVGSNRWLVSETRKSLQRLRTDSLRPSRLVLTHLPTDNT
ncbi:CocE/NonD family hydrolase [Streptomyces thinghirensis]|uniref:Xaa-Pro dipeptidyl-peptidase C-terminal domain-containing protein n=1 Tax=Streptomyces thinghirensis TaxID=551547 RepID=A0ABP9T755_9ACTN